MKIKKIISLEKMVFIMVVVLVLVYLLLFLQLYFLAVVFSIILIFLLTIFFKNFNEENIANFIKMFGDKIKYSELEKTYPKLKRRINRLVKKGKIIIINDKLVLNKFDTKVDLSKIETIENEDDITH